jgi:hypothetical protein
VGAAPKTPTSILSKQSSIHSEKDFFMLKPAYSSSRLLPEEFIGMPRSGPGSAGGTRVHSRKPSLSKNDPMTAISSPTPGSRKQSAPHNLIAAATVNQQQVKQEFEYGDEHLNMMDNCFPTFMQEMEGMLGNILVRIVYLFLFSSRSYRLLLFQIIFIINTYVISVFSLF